MGAVVFGLEGNLSLVDQRTVTELFPELDLFNHQAVIWRAFVTSAIAAVSLQYVDPYGTSKLVLFQVQNKSVWRDFELVGARLRMI